MRSTVMFLIGSVFGATGVLMWVHERGTPGLRAAERPAIVADGASTPAAAFPGKRVGTPSQIPRSAPQGPAGTPALHPVRLEMPVLGFSVDDLRPEFHDARGGGRTHEAIDIRAPKGTPVVAVADGRIRKLFNSKAGGLTIYQYDVDEKVCYYYAHLDRYAPDVQEGMAVKRGAVIGYVGTSGNAPPNTPHLHFAVTELTPTREWWKGSAVDPYPLLTAR